MNRGFLFLKKHAIVSLSMASFDSNRLPADTQGRW